MRKLVLTLLSSLAISVPFMGASPVQASGYEDLTYAEAMTKAIRHYSNFESSKSLEVLNHLNKRTGLSEARDRY